MTTPLGGHPEWESGSVNGPAEVADSVRSLERSTVVRYASASARAAAYAAASLTPAVNEVSALATDPGSLYVFDGSTWRKFSPVSREFYSIATQIEFNAAQEATVVVTFPAGRFSGTPQVVANCTSSSGLAAGMTVRCYGATQTQVTVAMRAASGPITVTLGVHVLATREA